jgi:hypothetical protein
VKALDVLRAVRDTPGLSVVEYAVLTALVLRCNAEGHAFPSYEKIARDAHVSPRSAKNAIAALQKAGHITSTKRLLGKLKTSNLYEVHVVHIDVQDLHNDVQDVHEGGAPRAPSDVQDVHPGSAPRAHDLPKRTAQKRTAQGRGAAARTKPRPSRSSKGTRLPEHWEPKPETVQRFREREHVDAMASAERFKNHWLSATGSNATKADWSLTFTNWVLEDIARGRATPIVDAPKEARIEVPTDVATRAEAKARIDELVTNLAKAKSAKPLDAPGGNHGRH